MHMRGLETNGKEHAARVNPDGDIYTIPVYPHATLLETGVTQILKSGQAVNAAVNIWTVTAGKTGYITSLWSQHVNLTGAAIGANIDLYDSGGVSQFQYQIFAAAAGINTVSPTYLLPVKILAGWTVTATSFVANSYLRLSVIGYEL